MSKAVGGEDFLSVMPRVNKILEPALNCEYRLIRDFEELRNVIQVLKAMGKRIVMTSGVYDLPHCGHMRYIAKAKEQGDILVLSVDTDEITRKRKGDNRPIIGEDERVEMLLHSRYVDIVTLRNIMPGENDDIEAVQPDVLVTSQTTADFSDKVKKNLEEKYGIEVVVFPPQAPTSTTARIRHLMIDGVEGLAKVVNKAIEDHLSSLKP